MKQYEDSLSTSEIASKERLDCTVRALARAFNLTYDEAHKICASNGRKKGRGMYFENNFCDPKGYFKDSGFFYGKYVEKHSRPGMTVRTFLKLFPKGVFIVRVPAHVGTIVNGKTYDLESQNQRVKTYWSVKDIIISKKGSITTKTLKEPIKKNNAVGDRVTFYHSRSDKTITGAIIYCNIGKGTYTVLHAGAKYYPKINSISK